MGFGLRQCLPLLSGHHDLLLRRDGRRPGVRPPGGQVRAAARHAGHPLPPRAGRRRHRVCALVLCLRWASVRTGRSHAGSCLK